MKREVYCGCYGVVIDLIHTMRMQKMQRIFNLRALVNLTLSMCFLVYIGKYHHLRKDILFDVIHKLIFNSDCKIL